LNAPKDRTEYKTPMANRSMGLLVGFAVLLGGCRVDSIIAKPGDAGAAGEGSDASASGGSSSTASATTSASGTGGAALVANAPSGAGGCQGPECDATVTELPDGFASAVAIPIEQSDCLGSSDASTELLVWHDTERTVSLENVTFRCAQAVCGFLTQDGGVLRVLLRPCDMNPTDITRCVCAYNIEFEVTWAMDRIEVYRQGDNYGTGEDGAVVYDVGTLDAASGT
jgi:hypothetical protein